ncbi:MAG: methyltransferase domain-containing protein, partial [Gammaproteobacteria bacterium]
GRAWILSLDFAPAMLQQARSRLGLGRRLLRRDGFLCADAEQLPLQPRSCDLLVSNLTLQWCNDPDRTFAGLQRVLRPGALLMFTTFGPDTLKELRHSWQAADGHSHVNAFLDMHDIGDALLRAGFADPVMDVEHFTLTYENARGLMNDLKALGAHNTTAGRPRGLTGREQLRRVTAAYEAYRQDGLLPASYEIIYGHCWVPLEGQDKSHDNTVAVPIEHIQGRRPCP